MSAGGRSVLVTGCSSGIGRAIALGLAAAGYSVFASVRKEAHADALRKLGDPNLIPVCPLDLTRLEQIPPVVEAVTRGLAARGRSGLYALINNAGAGSPSPVELMRLDKLRTELEARVLGSVAMVQAFLPMIRQARGRILWIATPATIPTPYVAAIHACDFAVNCIARTLDIELKPWKIPSILIRCGGIRTPAGLRTTSDVEDCLRSAPPGGARLYEQRMRAWGREMAEFDKKRTDPGKVADLVLEALAAGTPRRRYSTGHMARVAALLESLPQTVTDAVLGLRF